jgi:4-cresol dehydrogenase (hydroxylating)
MPTRRQTLQASAAAMLTALFRPGAAQATVAAAPAAARLSPAQPNPRTLAKALSAFSKIVGDEWVFSSAEDVALYRDPYSLLWGEPDEKVASAAVAPVSTEEVLELVRIANQYRIPIYPISTGKNLGYGGAAPVLPGSVVLDLKRMNRVLEVNERNAYAVVEPGVSYFDLYHYIQERNLKLWIDCPGPGWGSIVGNALDHGLGYTLAQYRNHFDAHCGMEVVLPTGTLMRTGMGAMPKAQTWQQFKTGYGPWIDGLFSQSNFGVVTKMGFWLMPQPEAFGIGRVFVPRYRDLIPLVDIMNRLESSHILQGCSSLSCPVTGTGFGDAPSAFGPTQQDPEIMAVINDPTGLAPERLEAIGLKKGIPFWSCEFNFYGPRKLIEAQWACAQEAFAAIPGVRFELGDILSMPLSSAQVEALPDTVYFGIPTLRAFGIGPLADYGGAPVVGLVFFSPVVPRTGEAAIAADAVLGGLARHYGLPVQPVQFPNTAIERSFLFVIALPVTRDATVNRKIRAIFRELIAVAAEHGWGEYRTTPAFYDDIAKTYSFNDHALLRFHETLKDAVDPNGILSAGRYGIWPRHLRSRGA